MQQQQQATGVNGSHGDLRQPNGVGVPGGKMRENGAGGVMEVKDEEDPLFPARFDCIKNAFNRWF